MVPTLCAIFKPVRLVIAALFVLTAMGMVSQQAAAQTPTLLPGTITSVAGNTPTVSTTSAACPTNAQFTATDASGNGCPAINAVIPSVATNLAVDALGNIYISQNSTNPQIIRKIDARSGIISAYAGAFASQCASGSGQKIYGTKALQTDKTGDNCPVAYTSGFNGPVSMGTDPYGNVLIGTTGDAAVNFICNNVSPICSATQAAEQLMIAVAACDVTGGTTSYPTAVTGTTVGTAGDGSQAQQFGVSSCTIGIGARVYAPTADRWDNVYFMDGANGRMRVVAGAPSITVNGVVIPNPLFTALQISTGTGMNYSSPSQGFLYPIAGGATGGTVCSGATDTGGDGCPFYQTLVNTGSTGSIVQGIVVDKDGDLIFDDGLGRLRVIYMGGTVIKGAIGANGVTSPIIGYSYLLVGTGTAVNYNSADPGVVLGKNAALQSGAIQTLALDPAGNVIIGDQLQVLFYDISTGYLRRLASANSSTSCNAFVVGGNAAVVGDGCPLAQSKFGAANKILPVGEDALGNLYMLDITNLLVRRVSALTLPTTVVNNAANTTKGTSTITVHAPSSGSTVAVTPNAGSDFTVGTPTCTTNSASDNSVDCTASVTFAPTAVGQRTEPISVATTVSSVTTTQNLAFNANSTGSALVFDPSSSPSISVLGASATGNTAVVLDGFGNTYVSGTQGISRINGSTVTSVSATAAPYIAVDGSGNVYAAGASSSSLTKYSFSSATSAYVSSTVTLPTASLCTGTSTAINCAATQIFSGPMIVDNLGFLYIVDLTNKHIFKYSPTTNIGIQLTQTALSSPTSIGQDSYGNLLVIDGTSVLKIPSAGYQVLATSPTANPVITFSPALTAPTSITADQGENIYVADGGNIKVQALSGGQYSVPGVTGSAVTVDGMGNLYTVASAVAGVTKVTRNNGSFDFGTSITATYTGVFGNAGATAPTGFAQTDTAGNFTAATPTSPVAASATTCNLTSSILAGGSICNVSFSFTPTANGNGPVQDSVTLLPATNTLGVLALNGTKSGTNATTTTGITGNTAGLIYTTGTETTFTVTVTETPAAVPSGTVAVTIDGGSAVNYSLTGATASSATATVPVSGLTAGTHTIVASYANSAGIVGSTSSTTNFSIGQASTAVSWTPSVTTQQYSSAIGTSVLNAAATSAAKSGNIPGAFIYTATPSGGSPISIHSASYLPIGTYALSATFVPTDTADFAPSTGSVATFTVTKATTTAAVGGTQFLVAADGSGNYTTVQAAVNALPSGGSIYIKPGTYKGFVTVVQPNVALRGLGGDPTKVVISSESGAFGSTYPYVGEFTAANSNGSQMPVGSTVFTGDEGSATIVVSKGINLALSSTQQTPTGFYGENFTMMNTYDTDSTTTTTTYASTSNGACSTGQATPQTYANLFNSGQLCASQALAIWTTADLSVMNNIYSTSLQDTIYTASPGSGSNGYVPTRQYWFRGKVTGDVDFIFGDAAAVFDSTSIYTAWHGATATGTETIEAQNKAIQTSGSGDYLSGYIMNNSVFTSQSTGMTNLFLGRPYGTYSTWVMLNSYIDQTNATGYTTGLGPALTSATYSEYNDIPYTDPATNSPDLNGVPYLGTGGNTGSGVTGTREAGSTNPGTAMSANNPPTSMTQAQAQAYFPTNFLSQTVSSLLSSTQNWNPTAAIATYANGFVPSGTSATITSGSSITVLLRPQTPGLGAITNGTYTIPTGTYTLSDSFNSGTATVVATGSLDAAGEASFITSNLTVGNHSFTWSYSGDSNFSGSTTSTPYVVTVTGTGPAATTITLGTPNTPVYGQVATVTATVSTTSGTPTGSATFYVDGTAVQVATLASGVASFSVASSIMTAGNHALTASYGGAAAYSPSTTTASPTLTVSKATLTITSTCANVIFDQQTTCSAVVGAYQYSDSASTVFTGTPTAIPSAPRTAPAGTTYFASPQYTLTTFGSTNYTVNPVNNNYTITGGAPQSIIFAPLPNFTHGSSYQLTARTTSGLPVTYSVTAGSASISGGSTLTVTGTGPVTVQASQSTDPTGDYAAATPVSRSFTAQ